MNAVSRTLNWPRASFVGFDRIWNELDQHLTTSAEASQAFPRHNIVKIAEDTFLIELALAGYTRDDLELELKDGYLVVSGEKQDADVEYLHKGISTKKFKRTFRLNEHVVVKDANFVDGLLVVELTLVVPEEKKARSIEIGKKTKALPAS